MSDLSHAQSLVLLGFLFGLASGFLIAVALIRTQRCTSTNIARLWKPGLPL